MKAQLKSELSRTFEELVTDTLPRNYLGKDVGMVFEDGEQAGEEEDEEFYWTKHSPVSLCVILNVSSGEGKHFVNTNL